jgi:uncharacterized protein YndB with AHSA1/START domain/DNA-binding transcriptional ArsR family regulator
MVTYDAAQTMEEVFRALADPSRRELLDRLYRRDGQSLTELESGLGMTRFGVMKHLRVLEAAGLVVTRKVGRMRLHYLNPVPIRQIHDRWIDKYTAFWAGSLTSLKAELEREPMPDAPRQVFQIFIRTTPQRLWDALTLPEYTRLYYHGTAIETDWRPGSPYVYRRADGSGAHEGVLLEVDPPHRLVMTFAMKHDAEAARDRPSRVAWEIEQEGDSCRLTVTHDNFEGETATYRIVAGGKPAILSSLKSLLETGEALQLTSTAGGTR